MKQILQDLSSGRTFLKEAPAPSVSSGSIIIGTQKSLISAGTERMLVDFGRASILQKAKQQPEKVRQVIEKARTDGIATTIDAVRSKLNQPIPLGYCNVGIIRETGSGVSGFREGDRVVSNGPHADVVRVPQNLCARVPDEVDDESAAFAVVASIGLQGIRLAQPTLGESFVVTGVGHIGLLTVQFLTAHGCRVLAIDYDENKLILAREFGAETCNPSKGEDPLAAGMSFSRGQGVDGVIIAASTKSSDPVAQAAQICRKRGRIVLVGVTGLELNRSDFYQKELSFQVSCSYGPGRYDENYEEKGNDYPLGFVRWTEQRNFEAALDMMSSGQLDPTKLISHRFDFEDAPQAYDALADDDSVLGIVLSYETSLANRFERTIQLGKSFKFDASQPVLGFIGAGNYASRMLIPAFKNAGAQFHTIVAASGINSVVQGEKHGFSKGASKLETVLSNDEINSVVIATRHNTHADFAAQSINAGKHVFIEKPLAITHEGLRKIQSAFEASDRDAGNRQLMVGFNRRFSPLTMKIKDLLASIEEPKSFIMTMNAGAIPAEHWTQDPEVGGGRIIGEACHYLDLMRFLAGSRILSVQARCMGSGKGGSISEDKASITLGFEDGSIGTILYFANGAAAFPKERVEVFGGGRVLQLDNFRRLKGYGWPNFRKMNLWRQDKGQNGCAKAFLEAVQTGNPAIDPNEIFEVAKVTLEVGELLRNQ